MFRDFQYRGYNLKQLDALIEQSERFYQRNGPVEPMFPNTLTNADGTPYQAGYDEKALGQIAYEAFTQHPDYQRLFAQKTGYRLSGPEWRTLSHVEQRIWEEVAQAVLQEKQSHQ